MKCYDKELIINGKAVRSPEQQVYKNMEDIEALEKKIQTWYASSVELTTSSNTILRSNTNVPDDVESGLLIDPVGNMFNITGGDETTLLITFYASIKGPQGEQGPQGTSGETDKGVYITSTAPTESESILTLSSANLDNINLDIPIKVNDLIIYLDSNNEPTTLYLIASINGTTLTLNKVGDYSKGKSEHNHSIRLSYGAYSFFAYFDIDNEQSTPFSSEAQIYNALIAKGHDSTVHAKMCTGRFADGNTFYTIFGIYGYNNNIYITGFNANNSANFTDINVDTEIYDVVN